MIEAKRGKTCYDVTAKPTTTSLITETTWGPDCGPPCCSWDASLDDCICIRPTCPPWTVMSSDGCFCYHVGTVTDDAPERCLGTCCEWDYSRSECICNSVTCPQGYGYSLGHCSCIPPDVTPVDPTYETPSGDSTDPADYCIGSCCRWNAINRRCVCTSDTCPPGLVGSPDGCECVPTTTPYCASCCTQDPNTNECICTWATCGPGQVSSEDGCSCIEGSSTVTSTPGTT